MNRISTRSCTCRSIMCRRIWIAPPRWEERHWFHPSRFRTARLRGSPIPEGTRSVFGSRRKRQRGRKRGRRRQAELVLGALLQLLALLFEDGAAAQLDLVALEGKNLDQDLVAFLQFVANIANAVFGYFADVEETVSARKDLDKGAEIHEADDLTQVGLAHFGGSSEIRDNLDSLVRGRLVGGRNVDGSVVLDIDFDSGLLDDAANDFAAGSDDVADLIGRDLQRVD